MSDLIWLDLVLGELLHETTGGADDIFVDGELLLWLADEDLDDLGAHRAEGNASD